MIINPKITFTINSMRHTQDNKERIKKKQNFNKLNNNNNKYYEHR